jgi:hypothetical protein
MHRRTRHSPIVVFVMMFVAAALAQTANPRIGRWKLKQDAPPPASNVMTYEEVPGGGMKVTVNSVNREGRKGGWTYTTMLDGKDVPIEGHPSADAASVKVVDARVNEIVYKKNGKPTQFLTNVLSEDGTTLTVTFKNPEGKVTAVAVYEKM